MEPLQQESIANLLASRLLLPRAAGRWISSIVECNVQLGVTVGQKQKRVLALL